ncbi:UPF0606 protein KIAA1549 isoform X2 [Chiloscyllium punctatum]|uniref:UPF0606 protein KIAA1549 isoform X2 n=1 Tax=Chiloscyllium punctatum TaxID=137246 RepID=UPI003B63E891
MDGVLGRRRLPLYTGYRPSVRGLFGNYGSFSLVASLLLCLPAPGSLSGEHFLDDAVLSGRTHKQNLDINDTLESALTKQNQESKISTTAVESALQSSLDLKAGIQLNSEETLTQVKNQTWSGKLVLSDSQESSAIYNSQVTASSESVTMVTEEYQLITSLYLLTPTLSSPVSPFSFLKNSATRQSSEPQISLHLSNSILVYPLSFRIVSDISILPSSKLSFEPITTLFSSIAVSRAFQPAISKTMANLDFMEYSETDLLSHIDDATYRTEAIFSHHMEDFTQENEISSTSNNVAFLSSKREFKITLESLVHHVKTPIKASLTSELVSEACSTSDLPQLSTDAALVDNNAVADGVILTEFRVPLLSTHIYTSLSPHGVLLSPSKLLHTQSFINDFGSGDDLEIIPFSLSNTAAFVLASSLVFDSFGSELLDSEAYNTHFSVPTVSSKLRTSSVPSLTVLPYYTTTSTTIYPSNQVLRSSFEDNFDISTISPSLLMEETFAFAPTVDEFSVASEHLKSTLPQNKNASYPSIVTTHLPEFLASESFELTSILEPSLDLVSSLISIFSTEASIVSVTEYSNLFESYPEGLSVFETTYLENLLSSSNLESSFLKPEHSTLNILATSTNHTNLAVDLESSFITAYSHSISEMMPSFESLSPSDEVIQPTLMPSVFESSFTERSTLTSSNFLPSTVAITIDTPSSTVDLPSSSTSTLLHTFPNVLPSSTETVLIATSFLLTPSPPPVRNSSDPTLMTILTVPVTKTQIGNPTATPYSSSTMQAVSSTTLKPTYPTTTRTVASSTAQNFVCDVNDPNSYLVTAVLSNKVTTLQDVVQSIKDILSQHFKRHVELQFQVLQSKQELTFMVTAGSVVFSGPAVLNSLTQTALVSGNAPIILSLQPALAVPDHQAQVKIVLQFVPRYVDVRFCNFTQRIEKGLTMAFAEVHRRRQEREGFTVQIINVTHAAENFGGLQQGPVNITFAINGRRGFLNGSDVSDLLRILNLVEFSFYLGFPVLKTAEPIYYPELNRSHVLKASWIKTVLLGVHDNHIQDKTFQAELERKLAQLISEATGSGRRRKRASTLGNNTVQVVNITKITGDENPTELIYFVEKQNGERLGANEAANLINKVDIQRAAIVLGYRIQGALARPVEIIATSPPTDENKNLWIIVAVLVPVIVVVVIVTILYWKFCRTDKLEFQPDTMSNIQQRQKLQVPSVKGFDFAKQHIGQHGKDDVLVIHEGLPPPTAKEGGTPSENGDAPNPQPKAAKLSKGLRQRSRISPSEGESTTSEQSSGRESIEDIPRPPATPASGNRRTVIKNGPAEISRTDEQTSSASIFDHVDRISRPSEASKQLPNKIQLIAMQPIPAPPLQNPLLPERVTETNKINKEVQRALRQKSEIEHHRNKIRLRAKRKGHYDFPIMDEVDTIDTKERRRAYRRAQIHIDRILDPSIDGPSVLLEPRKSYRAKRSPRPRRRHQVNGSMMDAEKDRLITTDSDGTYKKPPGVNNAAYVRYEETGMNSSSGAGHLHNHSTGYMQPGQEIKQEQSHQEPVYSNRPIYAEELKTRSSGHNPGIQAYSVSQNRVDNRIGSQPGQMRFGRPGRIGDVGWSPYDPEDGLMHTVASRDTSSTREHLEYVSPHFQMQRTALRDPSAAALHMQHSNAQHPGVSFGSTCTEDLMPGQSSTSLIKAIREELLRLSQKQSAFQNLHS